jgi:hypothetical protein
MRPKEAMAVQIIGAALFRRNAENQEAFDALF